MFGAINKESFLNIKEKMQRIIDMEASAIASIKITEAFEEALQLLLESQESCYYWDRESRLHSTEICSDNVLHWNPSFLCSPAKRVTVISVCSPKTTVLLLFLRAENRTK